MVDHTSFTTFLQRYQVIVLGDRLMHKAVKCEQFAHGCYAEERQLEMPVCKRISLYDKQA